MSRVRETPSTIVRHVRDYSEERSFDDKTGFERHPSPLSPSPPLPAVLSAVRANQEGKESGDRGVSDRNFCDIDFIRIAGGHDGVTVDVNLYEARDIRSLLL